VLFFPAVVFGQEQFGAAFSNYTPTNSVFLNPSSMLDAKTWLDIHIVGAGTYANNNFVSLDDNNFTRIIRTEGEDVTEDDLTYHHGKKKYHAYNRTFAQVLSGVWSQGFSTCAASQPSGEFRISRRGSSRTAFRHIPFSTTSITALKMCMRRL
jgi:hypothetical protein